MLKRKSTDYIVVHCSATPPDRKIGAETIRRWHVERGWSDIGYHIVITRAGNIEFGRDMELQGAHVYGHNHNSVGVCLVGGVNHAGEPENNFTESQFKTLRVVLLYLRSKYQGARVCGHRDFPEVAKQCPCFDVRQWINENRDGL